MNHLLQLLSNARRLWLFAVTFALVGATQSSLAQPVHLAATDTGLSSTADRMISYRQQEHSWQTADGAVHLMVNRGNVASGDSLVLYSSYDGGASWKQSLTLPGTDQNSTSDGNLRGNTLLMVYASAGNVGSIFFSVAAYDSVAHTWSLNRTETAFSASTLIAFNPAISLDSAGNYWCGFVTQDRSNSNYSIRMAYRGAQAAGWTNTGLSFGSVDNQSIERSARPVPMANGIGMIYTVHENFYWSYRLTGWAVNAPWVTSVLFTSQPPYDKDPYQSHFSVVSDPNNNMHLAVVDHGQLLYFRFINSSQLWTAPRTMTQDISATYPQASMSGSNVILMVNSKVQGLVLQSQDNGASFAATSWLTHPQAPTDSLLDYSNPRIEAPAHAQSPMPTWQQYVNGPTQGLMFFEVPVVAAATKVARR